MRRTVSAMAVNDLRKVNDVNEVIKRQATPEELAEIERLCKEQDSFRRPQDIAKERKMARAMRLSNERQKRYRSKHRD